jgi:hypothetical protein
MKPPRERPRNFWFHTTDLCSSLILADANPRSSEVLVLVLVSKSPTVKSSVYNTRKNKVFFNVRHNKGLFVFKDDGSSILFKLDLSDLLRSSN